MDIEKIKNDVNNMIQNMATGHPDAEKLKETGSDILKTAADLLSDSGINNLTGQGAPEEAAGGILKKLRDGLGLNGGALDNLRKAADELERNP